MTAGSPRLLAADSFRVRRNPLTGEAEVRGLDLHRGRFTAAVVDAQGLSGRDAQRAVDRVDAFLAEALPRIAAYGAGFPRLELRSSAGSAGDPELAVALRPLPELGETIALRSAPGVRLADPHRKGPSIARLAELNRELGAEALLLDDEGCALEGATTSLIWWPDGVDAPGCTAPARSAGVARVDSVTEQLLRGAARERLVDGEPDRARAGSFTDGRLAPDRLARCETWAVNALHGIRVVTSIDGRFTPEPDARRLRWFRDALDRSWRPIKK